MSFVVHRTNGEPVVVDEDAEIAGVPLTEIERIEINLAEGDKVDIINGQRRYARREGKALVMDEMPVRGLQFVKAEPVVTITFLAPTDSCVAIGKALADTPAIEVHRSV